MEKIICPKCGQPMIEDNIPLKKVKSYEDCIRKCFNCEIGASNAKNNPTLIYKDFKLNIPSNLLNNLDYTLENSNNIRNRENKKIKIGYSTSEDAVTWIFVKYFIQSQQLDVLRSIFNLKSKINEILIWGVPQISKEFQSPLINICRQLKETETSFSEPDLIIICEEEIAFVEVKVKSPNDKQDFKDKDFDKYLCNAFYINKELAKQSKYYELIRNWTILNMYENNKKHILFNLAPERLFYKENDLNFLNFVNSLNNKDNFFQLSWENVIDKMKKESLDNNIIFELTKRIL